MKSLNFYSSFHSRKESVIHQSDNTAEKKLFNILKTLLQIFYQQINTHTHDRINRHHDAASEGSHNTAVKYSVSLFTTQNSVDTCKCIERKGVNKMLMRAHGEIRTGGDVLRRVLGSLPMGSPQQKGDGSGVSPFCTRTFITIKCPFCTQTSKAISVLHEKL